MTPIEKIKELQKQIDDISKTNQKELIQKYSYLVGRYVSVAPYSYEKITSINSVYIRKNGDIIIDYTSVHVALPEPKHPEEFCISSRFNDTCCEPKELLQSFISKETFDTAFNKCLEVINNKILN